MRARVLVLRRDGVPLGYDLAQIEKIGSDKFVQGHICFDTPVQTPYRSKCLMIRSLMSAPGHGVQCMLFQPTIMQIQHTFIVFRGFEPVDLNGVTAGHLQEWATFIS